jgi:hypothetical protein
MARLATAQSYDAAMREAMGNGWVNQIINLAETVAANAEAFRAAGRDPNALLAAQIQNVIDGLDTATLATAAANLQGLDSVTSEFVRAAIATAQATAAMADAAAQAAQRIADAADYDAKMRSAMGLELVNTIVAIRQQIDAMASRYIAAGRRTHTAYPSPLVDFSVAILGSGAALGEEGEILWTVHPGDPVMPTEIPIGSYKDPLTIEEARKLGIEWVKILP